ncbi:MAG: AbgT family transporter [Myxococcota bacterium]|nr:AbgT family transporter [Myxococcota bacterium]
MASEASQDEPGEANGRSGWLDRIEALGNALPDPATLFALGALAVMLLSQVAVSLDWEVEKTVRQSVTASVPGSNGAPLIDPVSGAEVRIGVVDPASGVPLRQTVTVPVRARSLLTADGLYYALDHLVSAFVNFAPLGVVLVGMLGIGVAERSGFIAALLKQIMLAVPTSLLTPTIVFVGVMSSMGLDAGYVVLPPVAAALYQAAGRSPAAGLAAVFAGVAGGFGANLSVTSLDPLLAELSTEGASLLDSDYAVAANANLYFMIASTAMLTLVGWAVTARWVEPRFEGKSAEEGGPTPISEDELRAHALDAGEKRALARALGACGVGVVLLLVLVWTPGAPLHGVDGPFPRWVSAIVPLLFLGFLIPGIVYGAAVGVIRSDKDVAAMMSETISAMGSYIVLAFFAAQFIEWFRYSNLGEMLALAGGSALASAALPSGLLIVAFIGVVATGNLFIGSMSAKYAFFAPVFVPMLMATGISPELTQVAYRIGDSASNVITPLNPYMIIVLAFLRRYVPRSGIGTLVALMLPYTITFLVVWSAMLVVWMALGIPLGATGPLAYTPG